MATKSINGTPERRFPAIRVGLTACLIAIAAMSGVSTAAMADVLVVQSTTRTVKTGALIKSDQVINIPAGERVTFILPSGSTRTVAGPFKRKASELTRGVKANYNVFRAVQQYVKTGGSSNKSVGAVRGIVPSSVPRSPSMPSSKSAYRFSWHTVPITANGDVCVEKNVKLSLVRTYARREQSVTVVDMITKQRVSVVFPAGAKSVPWPSSLNLTARSEFALLAANAPLRKLRMRFIAPLPAREDTLRVLHAQRCTLQFQAYIRMLQNIT